VTIIAQTQAVGADTCPQVASAATERVTGWERKYVRRLVAGDAVLIAASCGLAIAAAGAGARPAGGFVSYGIILAGCWILSLAGGRAYETRNLGCGSDEYRRVFNSAVRLAGGAGLITVALNRPIAGRFLAVAFSAGTALTLAHRFTARRLLYRRRATGTWMHSVVVLGSAARARDLVRQLRREPRAGFDVVGVCVPEALQFLDIPGSAPVPVLGGLADGVAAVATAEADTVAVTAAGDITPDMLRRLAWALEGTDVNLVVAPALTDVAGPRVSIRPVAGLPLLHVAKPEISGARYLLKDAVERLTAALSVVLLSPLFLAISVAIKVTSPGPVLFRQQRVSRHGREFSVLKFRSMLRDAEALLATLDVASDVGDGPLFKLRRDPRVTRLGRVLRRYSLDELPQLINVVRGDMALVGPRPPVPREVALYQQDVRRRLLVKPGMTGLWQINGRSDLSWEDAVRLDLYYVENWSLAMDAQILFRTLSAVVKGTGAY
jgi:exopolysaccharide biosynthesis polyprenyl glycosylphosphotransferase